MAKMSNGDLLAFARNEVARSKNWRSKRSGYGYDEQWRRYTDLYSGIHYDERSGTDQLVVNQVFSTINVMAPAVAINNPRFVVNARKPENAANAVVTEEVLNYVWRRNDFQRDFRLAVLDFLIVGHGWLKVGWKSTKKPERKETEDPGTNVANTAPSEGGEEGVDDRDDTEGNVESELNVDPGEDLPFVERISVFDMYADPDARHPKEMRWIAQRTWRAVQDVRVDSRYSATQRKRVSGSHFSQWDTKDGDARAGGDSNYVSQSSKPDSGAISYCEIIEFYDLKRNTMGTFAVDAEGHDTDPDSGWLIKPKEIPYGTGHPFVMLRNYDVPDHFYPLGDVCQIESLQLELNETRTQMLNYRKKFRRAWTYKKDAFDRDGIRALESDEDNVMIPVMGDESPANVMAPVPAAITPPEFFDQSAMISNDLNEVSGVSDYARGNPTDTIRRTATEASMIQDAANSRAQDRLMKVEQTLSDAGSRIIQLMQQYMTGEQVARVVTIPVNAWVNYTKDYLQGDFDYEVRGGSTEPRNESFRRQSALQLADITAAFPPEIIDFPALYMKILRDGFGEKDPQRFIAEPPDPGGPMGPEQGGPPSAEAPMGPGASPPPVPGPPSPEMMPGGPMPGGPMPGDMPPELMAMMAQGAQPGGMDMGMAGMGPMGPPPQELTPEMLMALMAAEQGGIPPGQPM